MEEEIYIDVEHLISLVSQHPYIWDKTLPEYHSRTSTTQAWRSVCAELNPQFGNMSEKERNNYGKFVIKKWRNIRDQWTKAWKKVADKKRFGAHPQSIKYYIYHEQLSFLKKSTALCESESNYETDNPESPDIKTEANMDEDNIDEYSRVRKKTCTPTEEDNPRKKLKTDLEKQILDTLKDEDPKVLFFIGILPGMKDFSEDENLHFQCGVLNLIQNIKKSRLFQSQPIQQHSNISCTHADPACTSTNQNSHTICLTKTKCCVFSKNL